MRNRDTPTTPRLFWTLVLGWLVLGQGVQAPRALAQEYNLRVVILDSATQAPLAARVYLQGQDGSAHYFSSQESVGSAVKYEKKNWINAESVEYHTTVSAHPCLATVPPGRYQLTVERGKEYRADTRIVHVVDRDVEAIVPLKRWCDPKANAWYSGDTHLHRSVDDLRNIVLAEDLNVALPLTYWVTYSDKPPASGDKNNEDALRSGLIQVDPEHVIWPRNTEYEIFTVGRNRHTLGALFVLGHRGLLQQTVPPWSHVTRHVQAQEPQALFDMDKLDWPFAMLLPTLCPNALYELSNNHTWRTQFAFKNWNTPAPAYLIPPWGAAAGGHRAWLDYTHGMYHTLLNCGLRLPPSAGTASGVHPVPAGFGRVYVHLPNGFQFDAWMQGLRDGRSFVSTGPMLYATADGHDPGHRFERLSADATPIQLEIEVQSERPLIYGELLLNGRPVQLLTARNATNPWGSPQSRWMVSVAPPRSGWFAVRVWESHPDGQVRFAHTAPWYVEVDGQPVFISRTEKEYLLDRIRNEITRTTDKVGPDALLEYRQALQFYQALPELDDSSEVARRARPTPTDAARSGWLDNMIVHHRFSAEEVRQALGIDLQEAEREVAARSGSLSKPEGSVKVLPFPGGRHPRRGFLDGAIDPQRETKISVFPPWKEGGYVVVDVPEAIFSNLGLTYLAHTHIPTIWDNQEVVLERLEWKEGAGGWILNRRLPNGIRFQSEVRPRSDGLDMRIDLHNGTESTLTGLRVQVCTMLGAASGFNAQQPRESVVERNGIAVRADEADRWIITAWTPLHRAWQNPPVPCMHADPIFPDCEPGAQVSVHGTLRFYEGNDPRSMLQSLP